MKNKPLSGLPFEWMIGLRYTLSRRKGRSDGFVSFISAMSMASIALGVMALIIVLSVMNGFQKEVRDKMLSVLSHAEVLSIGAPIPDWQKTAAELKKQQPEIIGAAPFLRGQGLLTSGTNVRGVQLNGIDPETESQVSDVAKNWKIGQLSDLKPGGIQDHSRHGLSQNARRDPRRKGQRDGASGTVHAGRNPCPACASSRSQASLFPATTSLTAQ